MTVMQTSEHIRAMAAVQAAYSEGWSAAELWHGGDDDAPTSPPRGWAAPRRTAWNRGFADGEAYIEGSP